MCAIFVLTHLRINPDRDLWKFWRVHRKLLNLFRFDGNRLFYSLDHWIGGVFIYYEAFDVHLGLARFKNRLRHVERGLIFPIWICFDQSIKRSRLYNFSIFVDNSIEYGASVVQDSLAVVNLACHNGSDLLLLHDRDLGNLTHIRLL